MNLHLNKNFNFLFFIGIFNYKTTHVDDNEVSTNK